MSLDVNTDSLFQRVVLVEVPIFEIEPVKQERPLYTGQELLEDGYNIVSSDVLRTYGLCIWSEPAKMNRKGVGDRQRVKYTLWEIKKPPDALQISFNKMYQPEQQPNGLTVYRKENNADQEYVFTRIYQGVERETDRFVFPIL